MFCSNGQDIVCDNIITSGFWEFGFTRDILLAMKTAAQHRNLSTPAAGVFLDIGANVGWHSLSIAAAGYKTVGFEPVMNNERLQRSSICANPGFSDRMTLHSVLLSNESSDTCSIFSLNENRGNGIVKCDPDLQIPKGYTVLQTTAKVMMLDEFAASLQDVLVLKMDTEAHEPFIFAGGQKVFLANHIPYIVTEWNWQAMTSLGFSDTHILGILKSFQEAGYALKIDGFGAATVTALQVQAYATRFANPHHLLTSIKAGGIEVFMVHTDVQGLII